MLDLNVEQYACGGRTYADKVAPESLQSPTQTPLLRGVRVERKMLDGA